MCELWTTSNSHSIKSNNLNSTAEIIVRNTFHIIEEDDDDDEGKGVSL